MFLAAPVFTQNTYVISSAKEKALHSTLLMKITPSIITFCIISSSNRKHFLLVNPTLIFKSHALHHYFKKLTSLQSSSTLQGLQTPCFHDRLHLAVVGSILAHKFYTSVTQSIDPATLQVRQDVFLGYVSVVSGSENIRMDRGESDSI